MAVPISGPPDLYGQTAVVTGSAGGMGKEICPALAREGADVVAADVDGSDLETVVERVDEYGQRCKPMNCDVTDPEDVGRLYESALDFADSVEIVVNVAGVDQPGRYMEFTELTAEEWEAVMSVNLTGTFLVTQAFYDHMVENGYGKVVSIGSAAGEVGYQRAGPNYSASKAGVHAFMRWVAAIGAEHGVLANAIAPGPVNTRLSDPDLHKPEMMPVNRIGEPEDVAEAVVFLGSQASNFVTGTVLNLTGGLEMY